MKDNRMDLVRVDSQTAKDGLTLIFRFRREISSTEGSLKKRLDKEESIEVTIGKTLKDSRDKLTAVVAEIDRMIIEGD